MPTIKKIAYVCVIVVAVMNFSCNESPSGNYGYVLTPDYLGTNNAVYYRTYYLIDSLGNTLDFFADTIRIKVSYEKTTIGNHKQSIRIDASSSPVNDAGTIRAGSTGSQWYGLSNDSIKVIAYTQGVGFSFPKNTGAVDTKVNIDLALPYAVKKYLRSKKINIDSIYSANPQRLIYLLPLQVGMQWSGYPSNYFNQIRKVEGSETVTTKAGTFTCFKIRTSIGTKEFQPDELWYDYISKKGITLRTLQLTLLLTTEVNPDGYGRATLYERLELISQ